MGDPDHIDKQFAAGAKSVSSRFQRSATESCKARHRRRIPPSSKWLAVSALKQPFRPRA
jgi:hypothetical protein